MKTGEARRRAVLGDAHVDRAVRDTSPLGARFTDLATAAAWGTAWSTDAITLRERSMITLAILAATGAWEEFELHLGAIRNTGATASDIAEVIQHVGAYAGVPRANTATKIARRLLEGDT
ncbi:carboxymuconolactone decarboxylase family protein [Jannaschia sp. 2305UL9-9]|uniref:carboxymuconolactone decarboxylase family protein n=1 Tax=Jannaschia sp. 2305UL9-9 TaxID=3121638 RepID=UPI0035278AED